MNVQISLGSLWDRCSISLRLLEVRLHSSGQSAIALLTLLILLLIVTHLLRNSIRPIPSHHIYNGALSYTPRSVHWLVGLIRPLDNLPCPPKFFKALLAPPPLESWVRTPLSDTRDSPRLLSLHIFSISSPSSRRRRYRIRRLSLIARIQPKYRHVVEIKFILGYPPAVQRDNDDVIAEEKEIQEEMKEYDDIVRLNHLFGGEKYEPRNELGVGEMGRKEGSRELVDVYMR